MPFPPSKSVPKYQEDLGAPSEIEFGQVFTQALEGSQYPDKSQNLDNLLRFNEMMAGHRLDAACLGFSLDIVVVGLPLDVSRRPFIHSNARHVEYCFTNVSFIHHTHTTPSTLYSVTYFYFLSSQVALSPPYFFCHILCSLHVFLDMYCMS